MNLLDLLFPPQCVGCHARGAWLCGACQGAIAQQAWPRPCLHGGPGMLCPRCLPGLDALAGVCIVGTYSAPLKDAIWALKFRRKRHAAPALGHLLAKTWRQAPPGVAQAVVAIPMPPARQRARGFNQADLLARACASDLRLPYRANALHRTRVAPPQVGLNAVERRANVAGLFAITPALAHQVAGQGVIVIDDVLTTGATLNAAAQALRAAGATRVWGLVLARPRI
jgi:ComF family protein